MTDEFEALRALAKAMGVHTHYIDGLRKQITVAPDTLLQVCMAMGTQISSAQDAADGLQEYRAAASGREVPPVLVAWDGTLPHLTLTDSGPVYAAVHLADGDVVVLERDGSTLRSERVLPLGYHRLVLDANGAQETATVIAAPTQAWRRPGSQRSWGIGAQLAALRSERSRAVGDLRDVQSLCDWIRGRGGDILTLLPLLPTFNSEPPEPSPYSPVSRLFWSEIILDLGDRHHSVPRTQHLDVMRADAEVRAALAGQQPPERSLLDAELRRYADFRGAQARLGRNWRDWPGTARNGVLDPAHIDPEEERFHLVAQTQLRAQLGDIRQRLDHTGFRLGLDLAVGVHPDGYDPWSRPELFGFGMSVGAPPDAGFPSGQDWGFAPVLPEASRREGHRYLAASIAHQAALAGVLRVDHIMAWSRLYWIPRGFGLDQGTYVSYPAEELFAVLTLESHRHQCEVVGENLGTVPPEIDAALPRHRIWGMYLAQFEAASLTEIAAPTSADVALVGTHDTPTFAGWLTGTDIAERVRYGLLTTEAVPAASEARALAWRRLAEKLECESVEGGEFLARLLEWLGRSESPLVVAWLEDLWLEDRGVNLPGTPSSLCPNWQRPMSRLLDEIVTDPLVEGYLHRLQHARAAASMPHTVPLT